MKKIVTDRDVEAQSREGVFQVRSDMILTPSARDFAVNNAIRLAYEGSREDVGPATDDGADDPLDRAIREIVRAELGRSEREVEELVAAKIRRDIGGETGVSPASIGPSEGGPVAPPVAASTDAKRAVVTTMGHNQRGIIASITAAISDAGGDILDISQTLVGGYFTMIAVVDIRGLGDDVVTFRAFRERLDTAAKAVGVELSVMHEDILRAMHRI